MFSGSASDQREEVKRLARLNTAIRPSASSTNPVVVEEDEGLRKPSSSSTFTVETDGTRPAPRTRSTPSKRLRTAVATGEPFSSSTETSHATPLSKSSAAPGAISSGLTFPLNASGTSKITAFHSASAPANTRFVLEPSANVASAFARRDISSPPSLHGTMTLPPMAYPIASISFLAASSE